MTFFSMRLKFFYRSHFVDVLQGLKLLPLEVFQSHIRNLLLFLYICSG